jgi:hypothetical protein
MSRSEHSTSAQNILLKRALGLWTIFPPRKYYRNFKAALSKVRASDLQRASFRLLRSHVNILGFEKQMRFRTLRLEQVV